MKVIVCWLSCLFASSWFLAAQTEPSDRGGLQVVRSAATTNGGLYVDVSGRVGVGLDTPGRLLHVKSDSGLARFTVEETKTPPQSRIMMELENTGTTIFRMLNNQGGANKRWDVRAELTKFVVRDASQGLDLLTINDNGEIEGDFVDTNSSSRTLKHALRQVAPSVVLDKVLALPLAEWSYKTLGPAKARHFGPMAEDFYAAFGLGSDDRRLRSMDVSGVALGAIKGLDQKVEAEVARLAAEVDGLRQDREQLLGLVGELRERLELLEAERELP